MFSQTRVFHTRDKLPTEDRRLNRNRMPSSEESTSSHSRRTIDLDQFVDNAQRNSSQWVAIMRTDRRVTVACEPNSTTENVIFLESAFEIHARLLCCLEYRLRRCVSEGRMPPSKSRHFQDLAQKSGISQLRVMVEAAEQVLAA